MNRSARTYIPPWPALGPRLALSTGAPHPLPFPFNAPHKTYFYRASNAIYHLFRALRLGQEQAVLVPDYHSGNEVMAMRAAGATLRYYSINTRMEPDLDQLRALARKRARVLYVIHYAGWPQPIREMMSIAWENGLTVIEDCALTLLSTIDGQPLGSFGDYAVYCLYKTIPVPNGGLLVQNRNVLPEISEMPLVPCRWISTIGRGSELTLEWLRGHADGVGRALVALKRLAGKMLRSVNVDNPRVGNIGFDVSRVDMAISSYSLRLLPRFDFRDIARRRIDNYRTLQQRLEGGPSQPNPTMGDGVVPLFFPVLVADKHAAARQLWQRGISAVEFWNWGDPLFPAPASRETQFLRDHVLEIPIHQDVTPEQIDYIASEVARLGAVSAAAGI
jgi:dTDP-4-amino-4,6-dideoxygalactose transaminase